MMMIGALLVGELVHLKFRLLNQVVSKGDAQVNISSIFSKIKFLIKLLSRFFDTIQFQKWTNWRLGRRLASAKNVLFLI